MAHNMFLTNWVRTAYSMEMGLIPVLEKQSVAVAEDPQLQDGIQHHLEATRRHAELMRGCLERLGDSDLGIKPAEPVVSALQSGRWWRPGHNLQYRTDRLRGRALRDRLLPGAGQAGAASRRSRNGSRL